MEDRVRESVLEATGAVIRGMGFEPVEVEVTREGGRLLIRVLIDREGGVTLDDCAVASDLIGKVMEREDVIDGPYVLEVMSPGVNRLLNKPEDYAASTGKRVKVKLCQPFEGKWSFSGILTDAGKESFTLELGYELLELKYHSVSTARLDPELPW